MKIEILQALAGARQARGICVVIDVFRAFSTSCYLANAGVNQIYVVSGITAALDLSRQHPEALLIGEKNGIKPPGFHHGNSPAEIADQQLAGSVVILATSAGTKCLVAADKADLRIGGSFVNAAAIVTYLRLLDPPHISLICAGHRGEEEALEDTLCAEYLRDLLLGKSFELPALKARLATCVSAQKFFDDEKKWAPEADFHICTDLNKFSFVQKITPECNSLKFETIKIPS